MEENQCSNKRLCARPIEQPSTSNLNESTSDTDSDELDYDEEKEIV